jgi:hypothetical protein
MATREEKIKNAIAFFALEHERLAHKPLAVSFLHKYLAFLDFASVVKVGRPALGLLYQTMGRSSILKGICERWDMPKDDCFILVPGPEGGYIKATARPDMSCFSSFEVEEMRRLVKINTDHIVKAVDNGDDTREKTWAVIKDAATHLSDANVHNKPKEVSQMSGLGVLVQRYVKQLEELETRMKDVKRKLETVMEASRLLEEEGLSEESPEEVRRG